MIYFSVENPDRRLQNIYRRFFSVVPVPAEYKLVVFHEKSISLEVSCDVQWDYHNLRSKTRLIATATLISFDWNIGYSRELAQIIN